MDDIDVIIDNDDYDNGEQRGEGGNNNVDSAHNVHESLEKEHEEHVQKLINRLNQATRLVGPNKLLDFSYDMSLTDVELERIFILIHMIQQQQQQQQQTEQQRKRIPRVVTSGTATTATTATTSTTSTTSLSDGGQVKILDLQWCTQLQRPKFKSTSLEELNLSNTNIVAASTTADASIINSLLHLLSPSMNPSLRRIHLRSVDFSMAPSSSSQSSLSVSSSGIEELDLSHSKLTNETLLALLRMCPKLKWLSLRGCKGLREPSFLFAADLECCKTIEELDMMGIPANEISDECIDSIQQVCARLAFFWHRKRPHPLSLVKSGSASSTSRYLQNLVRLSSSSQQQQQQQQTQTWQMTSLRNVCPCCM